MRILEMRILEETKAFMDEVEVDLKERLKKLPEERRNREFLAQILDECLDGFKTQYLWSRRKYVFKFGTIEEAREFTSKVLNSLNIDRAEKEFVSYGTEPFWRYVINYKNLSIQVEPAEPDEDCKPVPKVRTLEYWACERKTQ